MLEHKPQFTFKGKPEDIAKVNMMPNYCWQIKEKKMLMLDSKNLDTVNDSDIYDSRAQISMIVLMVCLMCIKFMELN